MDILDTVYNHTKVDAQEGTVTKSPTTAELRAALADDKIAFFQTSLHRSPGNTRASSCHTDFSYTPFSVTVPTLLLFFISF
jgi:hypothetical protein